MRPQNTAINYSAPTLAEAEAKQFGCHNPRCQEYTALFLETCKKLKWMQESMAEIYLLIESADHDDGTLRKILEICEKEIGQENLIMMGRKMRFEKVKAERRGEAK